MAKLPEEGYVVSIGTEGYWVSDGFAELLIQLLQYGDTSNVILTTKTAIQNEKMELTNENKRLKEELELVRDDNTMFEEDVKELNNEKRKLEAELKESQRNNIELAADVKALEVRFDIVSAASIGFRKDIQKLQEENIKLMNVCNYLQHRNEGLSGSVEMFRKENNELKEQLEASSDLTMVNELANIFGEYTDAEQKNHNILIGKLAKFQDKHKLICVAGELKRG